MEEKYRGMVLELDYGKHIKIDLKDKKILAVLAKNSRIPLTKLSKTIGLSKDAIRYRIQKLKEKGLIRKNMLLINPFPFFTPYTILLRIENISQEKEQDLIKFFIHHPFIIWFGQCSGEWDFVINILATDIKHFDLLMKEIKTKCLNHLKYYESMPIMSLSKWESLPGSFYQDIKMDNTSENYNIGLTKRDLRLDNKELMILKALSEDCNCKIAHIAKKTGLSIDIIKYRIKKLIDSKIILAFKTIINASYLKYHGYLMLFRLHPNIGEEKRKVFETYLQLHNETAIVIETSGKWDFNVYIFAKDPLHFNSIQREIRNKFYGIIESCSVLLILKDYKLDFLPKGLFYPKDTIY